MMQRYAAISSSVGKRKIMHHFVVHPVHFRAAMPLERVVRHITASVQFDSKSSSNSAKLYGQTNPDAWTAGHLDRAVNDFEPLDQITIEGAKLRDLGGRHYVSHRTDEMCLCRID
jgi:hypothetical protein